MCRKLIYLVSFILVLSAASSVRADLVGHWTLDDGSGTTVADISGKGNDGTIVNNPTWIPGIQGLALEFHGLGVPGGGGDYIDCGNDASLDITGPISIALWIRPDADDPEGNLTTTAPMAKAMQGMSPSWSFQVRYGWGQGAPEPNMAFTFNTSPRAWAFVGKKLERFEWCHIACSYDGTTLKCYLNGEETDSTPMGAITSSSTPVLIGSEGWGCDWIGAIDDVRMYDHALSEPEILGAMEGGIPPTAWGPKPADGALYLDTWADVSWKPGPKAVSHDVYFGDNFDDVNEASRTNPQGVLVSQNQEDTTYDPPGLLEFAKSYYWRVDEFNDAEPNSPWKGNTWSFTVIDHFIVDDFEDYTDFSPDIIYEAWLDGWEVEANGSTVGYPDPPAAEQSIVHGGKQSMPFFYDNSGTANYSEAERSFSPAQDWTREDVGILSLWFRGHPSYVAGFTEGPTGTYTMVASGEDIWGNSDQFHFAWKEHSGAASIIAKVESVENTHGFAKAGVMIRDTLEADSANVALLITPENGVRFQFRNTAGGITDRFFEEGITAPQWVKLERTVGGLVRAYYSADGSTWTQLNLTTVAMNTPMYIGLALTSHDIALTCEAKFSNVTSDGTGQWVNQDIGMLSNEAEPMYVTVGDGSGTAATVYHANLDAALINTWTEWNIPLADLSNQGVVLTDVSKLAIGFGGADNPQSGGSGIVFFDDIRLYRPAPEPAP
jgi:hypothetical protein